MLSLLGLSRLRWNPLLRLDGQVALMAGAHAALAQVGLDHIAGRTLAQTAYGERRRVEIAMALAQNPKVLLLDEPLRGSPSTSGAMCRTCWGRSRAGSRS